MRAEWDGFNQVKNYHPQPHWHFTFLKSMYSSLYDACSSLEEDTWDSIILKEYSNIYANYPIEKMHFAMSENWINQGTMVLSIPEPKDMAKWIYLLLHHVQNEYEDIVENSPITY